MATEYSEEEVAAVLLQIWHQRLRDRNRLDIGALMRERAGAERVRQVGEALRRSQRGLLGAS
jgi:hypothetical protein